MPVYIAYQWPGAGLYPENQQYINTLWAVHKTAKTARGLFSPNESFYYPLTGASKGATHSPDTPYSTWCSNLAASGTKMVRVLFSGRQLPWGGPVYDFEPPPHGTFNIWHSVLDTSSSLTTYRSHQVSGSPGDPSFPASYWTNSNIKEFFDACTTHGIKVWVVLSHNQEWDGGWLYHPWNSGNRYLQNSEGGSPGAICDSQDKGFLSEKTQIYTNPDAITAFKARISFIMNLIGSYKCICMWGLCSEQIWNFNPVFWGLDSWTSAHTSTIRNYVVPFNATIAKWIRSEDPYNRPIASSVAFWGVDGIWPSDPDHEKNVKLEPLIEYPIDYVGVNLYGGSYETRCNVLNNLREKIDPKRIVIHQYYPIGWSLGSTAPRRVEYSPYTDSKRTEWFGAVLPWGIGPGRWPGLEEYNSTDPEVYHNNWIRGGFADPDYISLGQVTAAFRTNVDWKDWSGATDWKDYVSSTGLENIVCTGDGNHLVGILTFSSSGTKSITVSNVTDGAWTVKSYDWTDGSLTETDTPTASSNSFTFSTDTVSESRIVIYAEKD